MTNSVPIAARLAAMPSVSLQLLGGRVRGLTQAAVGEQTLRVLDTLRVDIAFIGTNAHQRPPRAVHTGQRRGRRSSAPWSTPRIMLWWLADSSKIGREDFVSFAPISSVDTLITDSEISAADRDAADRGAASRWWSRDRHRHPQPEHRPHGHARRAAHPRCGAPGFVGDHRARRQGRQRRARADARRSWTPWRVLPAPATDPLMARSQASRGAVQLRADRRSRCGPTSRSPNTTAPQPKLNEPGADLDAATLDAPDPGRDRQRRVRVVGGAVGFTAARRARPTGTPTSSRCSRRIRAGSPVDTSDGPLAALVASLRPGRARPDQAERRGARRRARLLAAGAGSRCRPR